MDYSPYARYLQYAGASGDIADAGQYVDWSGAGLSNAWEVNPDWLANPASLFDAGYSTGNRRSLNPYFDTQIRDSLRNVAQSLGLTTQDADRAALEYAQSHLDTMGGGYSSGTHPALVADAIARSIFQQAGRPYQGLSQEQHDQYLNDATKYQQNLNDVDAHSWQRDEVGGSFALWAQQLQSAWEGSTNDGWVPNERAFQGADNPWNTWLANKLHNEDYDPYGNEYGFPTKQNYEEANRQGIETGGAAFVQKIAQMYLGALAGQYGGAGGFLGEIGGETVAQGVSYAQTAKTYSDYYKFYQNWQAGGEIDPGALFNVATKAGQKIGDFDSSAFTGGDSPYNANSYFDETQYGSNFAGGNVYDESGNWLDGTYDDQGNFIPSDQTTFGDDYGAGYGQGNDIYGGGNLEQSNPELFGGGLGLPNLSGLGSLFSGLGSGLSGLLGNTGNGGNSLLALAPILAAIQHARNQGPFDTSRLTGLADQYSPDSMAYQYDRNTEDQRRSLTSSLSDRGVMGSSFGNMDISNFNTNRELGRGALISQASLGGADIANKILQAQIQQRQQQNQLYGSSLYALGNVFGGKR